MVKFLSILFLKLFPFFSSSSFSFIPLSSPFNIFFNYFIFTFFSGHKAILCSDFLLKPPTKCLKLTPSSYDPNLPHSPTPLQFYLARAGGSEVWFSNSCVFSPLAPNPTQHNRGAAVRLYAENTAVTQLQIQQSSRWHNPAIAPVLDHCPCAWPLLLPLHRQEGFASWRRVQKIGAEACPAMELEFPFPTHPRCRQQPTFPWRTTHPKSCGASWVSDLADFAIWRQKTVSSTTHLQKH